MISLREEQTFSIEEHAQIIASSDIAYLNLFDSDYFVRVEGTTLVAYVCSTNGNWSAEGKFSAKNHEVLIRARFSSLRQAIDFVNTAHLCDSSTMETDAWPAYYKRYEPKHYERVYKGK